MRGALFTVSRSVFDISRQKEVAATPEEEVRQQVVSWLIKEKKVPVHLIETEFALKALDPKNADRLDILVHHFRAGNPLNRPWLLVECKRPGVESPQALQAQVNKYLRILTPQFIMLALGNRAVFFSLSDDKKSFAPVSDIPEYPAPARPLSRGN
ncbi:type I restriction and modification enzyme subunit R-like protein [Fibrobacter sp. UWS1]|nr:type I restriction and modification enzyme subunit R-like protein [Fibrobacter sp. UWS1]